MIFINLYKTIEFFLLRTIGFFKFKYIGNHSIIKYGLFGGVENISIGSYVYIGESSNIWGEGGIQINDGSILGPNVVIRSTNHDYKTGDFLPYGPGIEKRPVYIGKNCWIGDSVIICPGTHIGDGVIIGMGAVVSGNIPDYAIAIGNPAKVIKYRDKTIYEKRYKEKKNYLKYKYQGKK